jgi:hypothetical protein
VTVLAAFQLLAQSEGAAKGDLKSKPFTHRHSEALAEESSSLDWIFKSWILRFTQNDK